MLQIPIQDAMALTLAFDPRSRRLAIASGAELHIYDIRAMKRVLTLPQAGGEIGAIVFSPDGAYVAAGCADKNIRIWSLADGKAVMAIPQEYSFTAYRLGRFVGNA